MVDVNGVIMCVPKRQILMEVMVQQMKSAKKYVRLVTLLLNPQQFHLGHLR